MTGRALAEAAHVPASHLCDIEAGRKLGSVQALAPIAAALRVDMEDLKPWPQNWRVAARTRYRKPPRLPLGWFNNWKRTGRQA